MTDPAELQNLINHIPSHSKYPNAKLQISIPSSSKVEPALVLKIINSTAIDMGWDPTEITVIRKSGYIICNDCKKNVHVHLASPEEVLCMNCLSHDVNYTKAEVSIIEDE